MKWTKRNIVANQGVLYLENEVNKHGSIFRVVHGENDIGIDGFIEYVENEYATGQLIAIQVKSGDSFLNKKKTKFVLYDIDKHIEYWNTFVVPVFLVFYSPTLDIATFIDIKSLIKYEEYHNRLPLKKIEVSIDKVLNANTIAIEFKNILKIYKDEKILFDCVEKCLCNNITQQKIGFQILSNHPFSKEKKITIFIAETLLLSKDIDLAKEALFILGYGVGRQRWSWNPNNEDEKEIIDYAYSICNKLQNNQIKQVILLTKGEYWNGPEGLGERAIDILHCCNDKSFPLAEKILEDNSYPLEIRGFCMYFLYQGDEEYIIENKDEILKNSKLKEVYIWMFEE